MLVGPGHRFVGGVGGQVAVAQGEGQSAEHLLAARAVEVLEVPGGEGADYLFGGWFLSGHSGDCRRSVSCVHPLDA